MKKMKPPISRTGRRAPIRRLIHWPDWEASLPLNSIELGVTFPDSAASRTSPKTSVKPTPGTITA